MSDYVLVSGVEYDVRTDRSYPYVQQIHDYNNPASLATAKTSGQESVARSDLTPVDYNAQQRRTYDAAGFLTSEQAKTPVAHATKLVLGEKLPPILNSVTAFFNKTAGSGFAEHDAANMRVVIVDAGSGGLDPKSSAQGSISIVPAVSWNVVTWHQDAVVNATVYEFTDAPGMTVAQIIARLLAQNAVTVFDLPIFKKMSLQIILKGMQVSVQQSADSQASVSANVAAGTSSGSESKGFSVSVEVGSNIRVETTPFCIFGALTITSNTDTGSVVVEVTANIPDLPDTGTPIITAITNEPTPASGTADASVVFASTGNASVAATTPAGLDTSKKYITDIDTREDDLGAVKYLVTVVDFAQYA